MTLSLLLTSAQAARETVTVDESKTIAVKISNRSFNRLMVQGDRVSELILSNEDTVIERDETLGAAYLRVPPGSTQKIDVTVITENGTVQDLTLEPVNQAAGVIVLKKDSDPATAKVPSTLTNTASQDAIITFMRYLANNGSPGTSGLKDRRCAQGFSLTPLRTSVQDHWQGVVYELTNTGTEAAELREQSFSHLGDVAIALSHHHLPAGQTALLYIISKGAS